MKYAHLPPNKKVGDYAYNHQALLGTGAFGKVYLGKELKSKTLVAIKVLENDQISDPYLKEALIKEVSLMKKLKGPNIVRFLDTLKSASHTYIIQEFCSGGDFRNYLTKKGKIPEGEARKILQDFLNGFSELVKLGYLHRDLKPENILIDNNVFKLADFGFATHVQNFNNSLLKTIVGTPLYMSPQILSHEQYTTKSDVWSTGLIYYEMLCGKTPWPARSQIELMENLKKMPIRFPFDVKISEVSKDFIKGCLNYQEKGRFGWEEIFNHPIYLEMGGSPINKIVKRATVSVSENALATLVELQEIIYKHSVDLKKVFKNFDKHGDGTLDLKEFSNLILCINDKLKSKEIEEIFRRFDSDGSGEIDFNEFQKLLMETDYHKENSHENQLLMNYRGDKMFKHLVNVIHNSRIDIEEIFKSPKGKIIKNLTFDEFKTRILTIDDSMEDNDIKYIFYKFDANNDKEISIDEFKNVLQAELDNIPGYSTKAPISNVAKLNVNASCSVKKIVEELRNIIINNGLNAQWVFERFDESGDRSLDFREFKKLIEVFNARYSEAEVVEVFKVFDVNGDGDISLKEFESFLK